MEPVLYDIKDAARYLGVSPSTLRYWEREGLVRAGRNPGSTPCTTSSTRAR